MSLIKKRNTPVAVEQPKHVLELHRSWRPKTLGEVIGQDAAVNNLSKLFLSGRAPHSYLLTGPSGCGKTTTARIIADMVGCKEQSILAVDAARYSGVDAMRELLTGAQYGSMGETNKKFIIMDEVQMLSKASWNALLVTLEEPPAHLYWALCTTEPDKVPTTIRTRCHAYDLKPVAWDKLAAYLEHVAEQEKLSIDTEFINLAARKAQGSVRQALVFLSMLDGITEKEEALRLIEDADSETGAAIDLARMIVNGKGFTWQAATKILSEIDVSPETIRLTILAYASSVLLGGKAQKPEGILAVLQAFSQPCNSNEKMAPILLSIGGLLFGE